MDSADAGHDSVVESIAQRFRRLRGDETFDDAGVRTIWHRGPQRTELLTWENHDGHILKQEFTFAGLVIEFSHQTGIRTGIIPAGEQGTDTGQPRSTIVRMQASPSSNSLKYGAKLLGRVPDRDYYGQHLLELINKQLQNQNEAPMPPSCTGPQNFQRLPSAPEPAWRTITGLHRVGPLGPPIALIAAVGIILGIVLGLLIFS